jgi:FHA domain
MTDQLLGVFKVCLLILLYLFFARVLWAVWTEVRTPRAPIEDRRQRAGQPGLVGAADGTVPAAHRPAAPPAPPRATRGRGGKVGRMIVIEPRSMKGSAFAVTGELSIGRSSGCTISIPDDTYMSQVHARITSDGTTTHLEDLGSTNGSLLNGNRVTRPVALHRGDRVQLGTTVLEAQ